MRIFVLCLVWLVSTASWGDELCTRNAIKIDVCQVAANLAEMIAPELPLRLNQSLVLQDIDASQNLISMRAVFDYQEAHLIDEAKGVPLDTMKKSLRDVAIAMACRPKTELEGFIRLGGQLEFDYLFSDKALFLTVSVDRCDPRSGSRAS
jgi:hypothetical protein